MLREVLSPARLATMEPEEAAAFLVVMQAEGLSPQEEALLDQWLASNPANAVEFEKAQRSWRAFDGAMDDDLASALVDHAREAKRPHRTVWGVQAAAAAIVLCLFGLGALMTLLVGPAAERGTVPGRDGVQPLIYATARGEVRTIRLPDGSQLTLDAETSLTAIFHRRGRTVTLRKGRAMFDVAPQPERPFAVVAGAYRAVAIGTRFEVSLLQPATRIALMEGRLRVGTAEGRTAPIELEAGHLLELGPGNKALKRQSGVPDGEAGWQSGRLTFDEQKVSEVAAIANRYSDRQIVVAEPSVGELPVSGEFKAGDNERLAEALAQLHGLRIKQSGTQIILSPER